MAHTVVLDKVGITVLLYRLSRDASMEARHLYGRIMSSWGHRPDRERVSIKFGHEEFQALKRLDLPGGVLGSDVVPSGYCITYQHPRKPHLEVKVRTRKKPLKKRTFKIGGKRVRLVAVQVTRTGSNSNHKEATRMATKTKKGKKAVEEDELEELEGLEDLDDLEDLEDEDEEEPEDEVDEDEDEEDEEPAPKKGKAKKSSKSKKSAKKGRTRKAVDEDEEEDDEDEEDEAPRKRTKKASSKSKKASKKSKSNGGGTGATRELPKGKLGPADIAEMVGGDCDARYVRIFLRDSEDYEREEGERWSFNKTEAKQLTKEIKARRKGN